MAEQKTFTEDEHLAVLADRVAKETSELTAERDKLQAEVTELHNKLDAETSARTAAEQERDAIKQEFEDFKAQLEAEREAAARKEERLSKLREAAAHLGDDFFNNESRIERIVAMSDEDFDFYVSDMAVTKANAGSVDTSVPRQTAMRGVPAESAPKQSVARKFLMGSYIATGQEG